MNFELLCNDGHYYDEYFDTENIRILLASIMAANILKERSIPNLKSYSNPNPNTNQNPKPYFLKPGTLDPTA